MKLIQAFLFVSLFAGLSYANATTTQKVGENGAQGVTQCQHDLDVDRNANTNPQKEHTASIQQNNGDSSAVSEKAGG